MAQELSPKKLFPKPGPRIEADTRIEILQPESIIDTDDFMIDTDDFMKVRTILKGTGPYPKHDLSPGPLAAIRERLERFQAKRIRVRSRKCD